MQRICGGLYHTSTYVYLEQGHRFTTFVLSTDLILNIDVRHTVISFPKKLRKMVCFREKRFLRVQF